MCDRSAATPGVLTISYKASCWDPVKENHGLKKRLHLFDERVAFQEKS